MCPVLVLAQKMDHCLFVYQATGLLTTHSQNVGVLPCVLFTCERMFAPCVSGVRARAASADLSSLVLGYLALQLPYFKALVFVRVRAIIHLSGSLGPRISGGAHPTAEGLLEPDGINTPVVVAQVFPPFSCLIPYYSSSEKSGGLSQIRPRLSVPQTRWTYRKVCPYFEALL